MNGCYTCANCEYKSEVPESLYEKVFSLIRSRPLIGWRWCNIQSAAVGLWSRKSQGFLIDDLLETVWFEAACWCGSKMK